MKNNLLPYQEKKNEEILNFINKFRSFLPSSEPFLSGLCYHFAKILEDCFPSGAICYEPIIGHFIYYSPIVDRYYDINGIVEEPEKETFIFNDYMTDEGLRKILIRDCKFLGAESEL